MRGPLRQLRQGHRKAERRRVGLGISCEGWALEFSGALEASTVRMGISAKKQLFGPGSQSRPAFLLPAGKGKISADGELRNFSPTTGVP